MRVNRGLVFAALGAVLISSLAPGAVAARPLSTPATVSATGTSKAYGAPAFAQGIQAATKASAVSTLKEKAISTLGQDKEATSKYPNADWQVAAVIESAGSHGATAALSQAKADGLAVSGGRVRVIVEASDLAQAESSVMAGGATVEGAAGDLIQVLATPDQLSGLVNAAGIRYVRSPLPHRAEAVTDEGVASTNASGFQALGNTGLGVKVAVIDDGFAGLAAAQASGDIPASVTTVDYCSGGFNTVTVHGTAVAEIVHEMAPNASLYLICIDTEVQLAQAEAYAKSNGISIVNHSVGWFNSSRGDGTGAAGTPDGTVADAYANGILWVNSAGNFATQHWSGNFVSDGSGTHPWNLFAAGDPGNAFTLAAGASTCALLKWDSWPGTAQDYDLYVFRSSDGAYLVSANVQNGSQPPTEDICFTNDGATQTFFIAIRRWSATAAPRFDLFLTSADLNYQVAAGSVTEPASAPAAFAAGAVCWQATTIEPFSSRGPTIDGRIKPDISGPDQTSATTYGAFSGCSSFTGFPGTSAASPHVAGAAALVKGANPGSTPAQIRTYLQTYSHDLGAPGSDSTYGSGLLFLPSPPGRPTAVIATAGDASASVSWTAPAANGSPITSYTVTSSPDGKTCATSGTSCSVLSLTNGTPYTFTVVATNGLGPGDASDPSNSVTPLPATLPGAPTNVSAIGFDSSAVVSWSAVCLEQIPNHRLLSYRVPGWAELHYGGRTQLHDREPHQPHHLRHHGHRDQRHRRRASVESRRPGDTPRRRDLLSLDPGPPARHPLRQRPVRSVRRGRSAHLPGDRPGRRSLQRHGGHGQPHGHRPDLRLGRVPRTDPHRCPYFVHDQLRGR